jgi:hypothetical protein
MARAVTSPAIWDMRLGGRGEAKHKATWGRVSVVLSSPRIIAVDASSWSAVGSWWAPRERVVSTGKKGDWAAKEEVSKEKRKKRENVPVVYQQEGEPAHNM